MAVSLKTIADELDVSVSLVSKVLNGRMGTSGASTRVVQAIRDKARALGYQRNRTATALATGKTGVIGVFIHRIGAEGSGVAERLVRGISSRASAENQRLWITFFETDDGFRREIPHIHNGEIDGLIVAGAIHPQLIDSLIDRQRSGLPVVTIYDSPLHESFINVGSDQVKLMQVATDHLLERDVREPAHIIASEERAEGFRRSLERHGLAFDPRRSYSQLVLGFEYDAGRKAVEQWIAKGVSFDGIVAQSDQQALGALHTLMRHGFDVPGRVRLIGVDNSHICQTAYVPLSSVSEEYGERGAEAVRLLARLINGQDATSILVEPSLHVRRSTE